MLIQAFKVCLMGSMVGLIGCNPSKSIIEVEMYDQKLPFSGVMSEKGSNEVFWACGDNFDLFKSTVYSPNPGPKREWCLRIDIKKNKALFSEKHEGSEKVYLFIIDELSWTYTGNGYIGCGMSEVQVLHLNDMQSYPATENTKKPRSSRIRFELYEPFTNNELPNTEVGKVIQTFLSGKCLGDRGSLLN